jgi:hypothetical protein
MPRSLDALMKMALIAAGFACGSAAFAQSDGGGQAVPSEPPAPEPGSLDRLISWLERGYAEEPALMIALAAVLVLSPVISIGALVAVSAARARERAKARREAPLRQAMQAAEKIDPASGGRGVQTARRRSASLRMLDGDATSLPLRGTMVRIGRHEENDIRLASKTVHRYHAVVHVTDDLQYVLTDLSGRDGNGIVVNGVRVEQTTLHADDVIELGEVKLRFSLAEAAAA